MPLPSSSFAKSSGFPVSGGKVPKCMGITFGGPQQAAGESGFVRAHGVQIADRQKRQLRMVELLDEVHVAEHVGIAGEVQGAPIGESQHIAGRFAAVYDLAVVQDAAAMHRVRHGESHAARFQRSALVHAARVLDPFALQPGAGLVNADDLGPKRRASGMASWM